MKKLSLGMGMEIGVGDLMIILSQLLWTSMHNIMMFFRGSQLFDVERSYVTKSPLAKQTDTKFLVDGIKMPFDDDSSPPIASAPTSALQTTKQLVKIPIYFPTLSQPHAQHISHQSTKMYIHRDASLFRAMQERKC